MNGDGFDLFPVDVRVVCILGITAVLAAGYLITLDPVVGVLLMPTTVVSATLVDAFLADGSSRRFWGRYLEFDKPPLRDRPLFGGDNS